MCELSEFRNNIKLQTISLIKMLSLTIPSSTILWIEGRRLMSQGKFKNSVSPLLGALMSSPPGESTQKFNILLDLGYSIAKTDELCYSVQFFEKAFAMVHYAPDTSRKAELYTNLAHCYLEELIDTFDFEKKQMLGYQALSFAGIARDCYFHIDDKKRLHSAKELEDEIKSEMNDFGEVEGF